MKDLIQEFREMLASKSIPDIDIGLHCDDPYLCDFKGHCWKHIPSYSVFDISRLSGKRKFALYQQGIVNIENVPGNIQLSEKQQLQVDCWNEKRKHIDKKAIQEFLQTLQSPLYFMDFETIQPAIPLYDNTHPYQFLPFQYSLHYRKRKGSALQHCEFLAEAGKDPRENFITQLLGDTKSEGDILVFNKSFEATRLKELAKDFPEYAKDLNERIARIKDLMTPFEKKWYYDNAMEGSHSIKKVFSALVPKAKEGYKKLVIQDGGMAMKAYAELQTETDKTKIAETRKHLLEYCKLDTLAMVKILEVLEGIVGKEYILPIF